jgi:hypothetical protein
VDQLNLAMCHVIYYFLIKKKKKKKSGHPIESRRWPKTPLGMVSATPGAI